MIVAVLISLGLLLAGGDRPKLEDWQASRVVRSHASLQQRPDFRVERIRRLGPDVIKVCWSEPGYLSPEDGRDYGCDVVTKRGDHYWLKDDSTGGRRIKWL